MITFIRHIKSAASVLLVCAAVSVSVYHNDAAADEDVVVAYPDKWMVRPSAYIISRSNTQVSLNSSTGGIGTTIDYQRDLGGDSGDTIPRLDAYYRFNNKHRLDFTIFSVNRKGSTTLAIDIDFGDKSFNVGETVLSEIDYELYKVDYSYSFYHSTKVELSFSAGLNITSYDVTLQDDSGGKFESAGVTVPLPMFGLRMGYAISPKWYVRFMSEMFFIEIEDVFRGGLLTTELNTEYRILKNFAIGAGFARIGLDVEVFDDDWTGKVIDSYNGITLFGTFYF